MTVLTWILLGFVGIVVLGVLYLAACRIAASRRKHSKGDSDDHSSEKSKEKPAKKEHSSSDHGGHAHHGSGGGSFFAKAVKIVLLIALIAGLLWLAVSGWFNQAMVVGLNAISNTFFGTSSSSNHVQYLPSQPVARMPTKSNAPPTSPGCEPFEKGVVHVCVVTEPTFLMVAPGTPGGLTYCWTPADDKPDAPEYARVYKDVEVVFDDGIMIPFDAEHQTDIPVEGYQFVPQKNRIVMRYWLTKTTCEAPLK